MRSRLLRVSRSRPRTAPLPIARLHLVTPDRPDVHVVARARAALGAGAPWIQVRTKSGTDCERLAHLQAIARFADDHGATCLGNDRADLALAAGATGVHLGADDLPVAAVRAFVPASFIIGATVREPEAARRARDEGADYLGVGPVHATTTKVGLPDPIGLHGLATVAAAVDLPVIAIGGITVERVAAVLDAGAHGVAVVGAVFSAPDVAAATAAFLEALGAPQVVPASGDVLLSHREGRS